MKFYSEDKRKKLNLMNLKYGDLAGNTQKLDFQYLNFLVHMVEIFNSFNMEKTEKEINFHF